jgi:uncharacterized repeat protein (TIGR02543 family)
MGMEDAFRVFRVFRGSELSRMVVAMTAAVLLNTALAAEPTISVFARQRYPWNGLVDVHFTITGDAGTKYDTSFTAKDMVGNTNIAMRTIRKSDGTAATATEQLLPGTYNWVWDTAADLPKGFKCNRVRVAGTALYEFPYSVKFNANGGKGTMANESFTYGTAKALTANAFTREGYTFQGWATSASGAKVYNDKQSVSNLTQASGAVVNLYAVWSRTKVRLWAGGPYWATMNIGATKPEGYGYYFWWGDTVGYKWQNSKWVASDGSSSNFSNVLTDYKTPSELKNQGWITADYVLVAKHDAASVHWGGVWRMPTEQDFENIKTKCTWTWTTKNGVKGYVVSGKGSYASSSIFLPAAGIGNQSSRTGAGSDGYYWSSVACELSAIQYSSCFHWIFSSTPQIPYQTSEATRPSGMSIRPVCSQ